MFTDRRAERPVVRFLGLDACRSKTETSDNLSPRIVCLHARASLRLLFDTNTDVMRLEKRSHLIYVRLAVCNGLRSKTIFKIY